MEEGAEESRMQKVFDYIEKEQMIQANDKVIVGVSGGADSLCLLFVLLEYRRQIPFSLAAVHVEHGVRGEESLEDADFVEEICREYGVLLRRFSFDIPRLAREKKLSVEEAGRSARYEAFAHAASEMGADKIAVAHNKNDQAETMLFHMARGSGLAGAGGIRPVRDNIIRPLLCLKRSEIEEYLRKRQIHWRVDRTNKETRYSRNCIRHHILPVMEKELNPGTIDHMGALAEDIRRVEKYLDRQAEAAAEAAVSREEGGVKIRVEKFLEQEELIRELVLKKCLLLAGCGLKDVTRYHIERLGGLFSRQSGRRLALPGGWEAQRVFDEVHIKKEAAAYTSQEAGFLQKLEIPGSVKVPRGVFAAAVFSHDGEMKHREEPSGGIYENSQKIYTEWLNYDRIKGDLYLRTRQPGDFLVINRSGGRKKLKEYFIEAKIPAKERNVVLVLASGNEILWVVGYRISEAYKISTDTEKILQVQMKEEK